MENLKEKINDFAEMLEEKILSFEDQISESDSDEEKEDLDYLKSIYEIILSEFEYHMGEDLYE